MAKTDKYYSRYEFVSEKLCNWLEAFAENEAVKLIKEQADDLTSAAPKTANHLQNILDIVERKKKETVADRVLHYRKLVGLDLLNNLEKEGGQEQTQVQAAAKYKRAFSLSIRDKKAEVSSDKDIIDKIKQFIPQVIKNRNGAIATPAILEQLENYLKVDKEWLREHLSDVQQMIDAAKEEFKPQKYNEVPVNELARTDEPLRQDKEPVLSRTPASQ